MEDAKLNSFEVFAAAQAQRRDEYGRIEEASRKQADRQQPKAAKSTNEPRRIERRSLRFDDEEPELVKLNIMVTSAQKLALKRRALDEGVSASALVRELLDKAMRNWPH